MTVLSRNMGLQCKESMTDGDIGTAAKHYLEKLKLIVAYLGHAR